VAATPEGSGNTRWLGVTTGSGVVGATDGSTGASEVTSGSGLCVEPPVTSSEGEKLGSAVAVAEADAEGDRSPVSPPSIQVPGNGNVSTG